MVDARDYHVPTASQRAPGIEVKSVFVSKVERFQGPNSIYANARSSSPVVARNKRALNDLDANGAHPDDTPRKRATRVSRRQADAAL